MNARVWARDRLAWGLALTLALGLISTFRLAGDIGRPYGGFLEEYLPSQGDRLQVDSNTPRSWPNIAGGDLINHGLVAIDGAPYRPNQAAAYAAAVERGAPSVMLTIEREGTPVDVPVAVTVFTLTDYLDVKLPIIVMNVALWLLAVVVYSSQPADPLNRAASWLFSLLALALWTPFVSVFWNSEPDVWWLNAVTNLAWPLLGGAVIAFAWQFPRPIRRAPAWIPTVARGVALVLGLVWGGCRLWIYAFGWSPQVSAVDGLAFTLSLSGLLPLSLVVFVARLTWSWIFVRDLAIRRGLFIVTVGMALASPPIVLFLLDMAGGQATIILASLDLRYLLLAIPASYAFVILRYRTFRTADPAFLVVVILGLGALLASLGSWSIRRLLGMPDRSLSESFIPVFVVCLVASFFWATQTTWQGLFSRLLHWERSSYASARSFGERLIGRVHPDTLPEVICHTLRSELKLDRVAVWRYTHGALALAGQAGAWPSLPEHLDTQPAGQFASGLGPQRPLRLNADLLGGPAWLEPLAAVGAEVAVTLTGTQGPLGLLVLGKKWDEDVFDERDIEIVALIAQQASLVWMTAEQMSALRQVPALLAEAQKRERFRIAQDLHDTVQQRLGGIQLLLDTCGDLVRADPDQALRLLERCTVETERTAQIVSRIRDNLAPPEAERWLNTAVAQAVAEFERKTGVSAVVEISPVLSQRLTPEAQNDLVLVTQQALDNIAEHAAAQRVHVTFVDQGDRVGIQISDDGHGFSESRRRTARAAGSFGLLSMQARVLGLGGELRIESSVGAGTRIIGWIPLGVSTGR